MIVWLEAMCPVCLAQPSTQCTTTAGVTLVYPHVERTRLADRLGTCRECLSVEKLDPDGRIVAHKQLYGIARTSDDCDGGGEKPDADS